MNSPRTIALQAECGRLSALQRKASGARYAELDRRWTRCAVLLNKSRLRDRVRRGGAAGAAGRRGGRGATVGG
jgi:hypothetical protein